MAGSTATTRKLVLKMSVSLDGFVAGPNGEVDWIFRTSGGRRFNVCWSSSTSVRSVGTGKLKQLAIPLD